jgi:hypothetical protein
MWITTYFLFKNYIRCQTQLQWIPRPSPTLTENVRTSQCPKNVLPANFHTSGRPFCCLLSSQHIAPSYCQILGRVPSGYIPQTPNWDLQSQKKKLRLTKEDVRPILTPFKFDLRASSRVLEHATTQYETLVDRCQLVELEIQVNKTDIATHFCLAASSFATRTIKNHLVDNLI